MARACAYCEKTEAEITIKYCAKCSTTSYCSRDCQKSDWKVHKKVCAKQAGAKANEPRAQSASSSTNASLSPPKGLDGPVANPFTRLVNGNWLHGRPEKDVYRLLIDSYRLRVEDDYTHGGDVDEDSIYSGSGNGLGGFRRFLNRVQSRAGLLPPWWNPEKRQECEQLGLDSSQWSDLGAAVEKSDIVEHYGDPRFPMQLRMFAEKVIGTGPGGQNGASMLAMMAGMEGGGAGGMGMSMVDATTGRVVHEN